MKLQQRLSLIVIPLQLFTVQTTGGKSEVVEPARQTSHVFLFVMKRCCTLTKHAADSHLQSRGIPSALNRSVADPDALFMRSDVCVWERSQLNESAEEGDGGCNQAEKIRGRRAAEDLWEQTLVI